MTGGERRRRRERERERERERALLGKRAGNPRGYLKKEAEREIKRDGVVHYNQIHTS